MGLYSVDESTKGDNAYFKTETDGSGGSNEGVKVADMPKEGSSYLWREIIQNDNSLADAAKISVEERFLEMLETGHRSDLTVLVGPERKTFKVHKILLDFGSPVMKRLISKLKDGETLDLDDVDVDAFYVMLKYFYLRKSEVEVKDALLVFKVAQDFLVQELVDECVKKLQFGITEKNVLSVYNQAVELGRKDLIEKTAELICLNAYDILEQSDIESLSKGAFKQLLQSDELNATSELQVFEAVVRWAKAECVRGKLDPTDGKLIRQALEHFLNLIRFPVMDPEEFTLSVAGNNILNLEEVVAVLMYFTVSQKKRGKIPNGRFNSTPRNYAGCSAATVDIYPQKYKINLGTIEEANPGLHEELIYLKTPNDSICLTGLSLFGLQGNGKTKFTYNIRRVERLPTTHKSCRCGNRSGCGNGTTCYGCGYPRESEVGLIYNLEGQAGQEMAYREHEVIQEGKVDTYNFKSQREITFRPIQLQKSEQYRLTVTFKPENNGSPINRFKCLRAPFFAPRAYDIILGDVSNVIEIGRHTQRLPDGTFTTGFTGAAVEALQFRYTPVTTP